MKQTDVNGRDTLRVQDSLQRRLEVAAPCRCPPIHPRECLRKYVTPGIKGSKSQARSSNCLPDPQSFPTSYQCNTLLIIYLTNVILYLYFTYLNACNAILYSYFTLLTTRRPSFPRRRIWVCRGRPRALVGIYDLLFSPLNPRIYGVGRLFSVIVGVHPANLGGQTCRLMSQCRQRMPVRSWKRARVSMTVHMFFVSIPLDFFFVLKSDVNRFPSVSLVVVLFVWLSPTRTRTRHGPVQSLVEPFILPAICQRGY